MLKQKLFYIVPSLIAGVVIGGLTLPNVFASNASTPTVQSSSHMGYDMSQMTGQNMNQMMNQATGQDMAQMMKQIMNGPQGKEMIQSCKKVMDEVNKESNSAPAKK
ncbi:hypothetical protein [Aneurinibacillus terranovensis]|uniref:hypothetical protein n=1 Tax=Aneurinibacillus terranovensis TaxID=278991 RepID=UPI00040789F3|nr:hypothetical protein [Aneurinibacillus terranovensis]